MSGCNSGMRGVQGLAFVRSMTDRILPFGQFFSWEKYCGGEGRD